ncbi:MAG: 4Fe-4S binding protein [Candidatus Cyclobacteriaceae bacterium M2_1C_046]
MNGIQKTGLALFIASAALLIATLFIEKYQLNDDSIEAAIGQEGEREASKQVLKEIKGRTYHFNHNFLQALEREYKEQNEIIIDKYKITDEEVDRIVNAQNPAKGYDNSVIANLDLDSIKTKQLQDYTSWLKGKEFSSKEELRQQLEKSAADINKDLAKNIGYNEEKIEALQLALTRQSSFGPVSKHTLLFLLLTIGLGTFGGLLYILPKLRHLPGIKNNNIFHSKNTGRGWIGYIIGFLLIAFYIVLYWFPEYMTSWMILVDPISKAISGYPASQWFFYGLLYTLAILVMGIRMLIKYRHSNYHKIRTASVMFFQLCFAFLIPEILIRLNYPSVDLKNIWPLNYSFFYEYNINNFMGAGIIGISMFSWGLLLIFLGVPILSYFYGKRWYCSWVCGCGGLAETLGDPYRQLSDKSLKAWQIERWMVHGVLVFAVVMTVGVLYTYFSGSSWFIFVDTYALREWYGFFIGAAFAGVVGVGFYPFMGNRVWCRFGCPLAAYIGLVQRFKSRFRITTNGGQCISCGNCSTYCEMGIDVRWYAQRQQNIVRSSCVGCGVCASVCPRGVLKLENGDPKGRFYDDLEVVKQK